MVRTIGGATASAVAWVVLVFALGFLVGALWPEFAVASRNPPTLTVPMLAARLAISFAASLTSGAIAARIGGERAALVSGALLLVVWGPYHALKIWDQFPVWYHLTFLISLPLLGWFGARIAPNRQPSMTS